MADLTTRGHLDDAELARKWVQTRASVRLLGPVRLREELRRRGVAPDLAEAALRESFEAEGELTRALEAGRRRLEVLGRDERAARRLRDHLLRQGYPGGVVTRVVRTLLAL